MKKPELSKIPTPVCSMTYYLSYRFIFSEYAKTYFHSLKRKTHELDTQKQKEQFFTDYLQKWAESTIDACNLCKTCKESYVSDFRNRMRQMICLPVSRLVSAAQIICNHYKNLSDVLTALDNSVSEGLAFTIRVYSIGFRFPTASLQVYEMDTNNIPHFRTEETIFEGCPRKLDINTSTFTFTMTTEYLEYPHRNDA